MRFGIYTSKIASNPKGIGNVASRLKDEFCLTTSGSRAPPAFGAVVSSWWFGYEVRHRAFRPLSFLVHAGQTERIIELTEGEQRNVDPHRIGSEI